MSVWDFPSHHSCLLPRWCSPSRLLHCTLAVLGVPLALPLLTSPTRLLGRHGSVLGLLVCSPGVSGLVASCVPWAIPGTLGASLVPWVPVPLACSPACVRLVARGAFLCPCNPLLAPLLVSRISSVVVLRVFLGLMLSRCSCPGAWAGGKGVLSHLTVTG